MTRGGHFINICSMHNMIIQEFSCIVACAMNNMYYYKRKFRGREAEFQLDLTASKPRACSSKTVYNGVQGTE